VAEKIKIMVVDDEPDIVKIVKIAMELANYEIIEAYSGEECLDKLSKGPVPDLVLLDIMMPGMSGYETCEKIRENKGYKGDAEQGLKVGADDYIIKPFDPYELIEQVKEILEK
jgi:DNA-binding response OmpR family regulator